MKKTLTAVISAAMLVTAVSAAGFTAVELSSISASENSVISSTLLEAMESSTNEKINVDIWLKDSNKPDFDALTEEKIQPQTAEEAEKFNSLSEYELTELRRTTRLEVVQEYYSSIKRDFMNAHNISQENVIFLSKSTALIRCSLTPEQINLIAGDENVESISLYEAEIPTEAPTEPQTNTPAEYEKYPNITDFNTNDEYYQELSDGIKDGRYFADFDGNGRFDLIDTHLLLHYMATIMTDDTPADWEGRKCICSFVKNGRYSFLNDYDVVERDGMLDYYVTLNNDMLENVKKYGDVNGSGVIDTEDASIFMTAYNYNFEKGDVNRDGSVDASDASFVLEHYSMCQTSKEISDAEIQDMIELADMNGDSVVDASDASLILIAYAESLTS